MIANEFSGIAYVPAIFVINRPLNIDADPTHIQEELGALGIERDLLQCLR